MSALKPTNCPVCLGAHDAQAKYFDLNELAWRVSCDVCGEFVVGQRTLDDHLIGKSAVVASWTPIRRAALSHVLRTRRNLEMHVRTGLPLITDDQLRDYEEKGLALPTPSEQARSIIRFVGDHERATASVLDSPPKDMYAVIGAPTPQSCWQTAIDLKGRGYLDLIDRPSIGSMLPFMRARLTLNGWEFWEQIKKGTKSTGDGFIAMQFGEPVLDEFVAKTIKPGIERALNCTVHRMDSLDVARAGIIDNIMREAIQDASFVLVELSHGNKGAYWEAGYAEGLGKPVIYLCEQNVWDDLKKRPHFDVNHHTTVMWDKADAEGFMKRLIATIRNSLSRAG